MARTIELHREQNVFEKILHLDWMLVILIVIFACIGFASLYSAAGGSFDPWASRQIVRFLVGMVGMLVIAIIDIKWWQRLAYPAYVIGVVLLISVEIAGHIGMGAQRWIDLGFIKLQPSELMKIALVMAIARYFHGCTSEDTKRISFLILPAIMIIIPFIMVALQPDLGTSLMIAMLGAAMFFMAGAPLWIFIGGIALAVLSTPLIWMHMHEYQKQRVLTFLNPESDPLGTGYHILQSKIALGSGGLQGKGFLNGTQSHLNFLPEKQTDFIFTLWAEEWGLFGGLFLLAIVGLIFCYSCWIAYRCRHMFGRLLAFGIMINFSLYVFVNIAMVTGIIPVVGAPLPLISYGGTALLAVMAGFGLVLSCSTYSDSKLPRL